MSEHSDDSWSSSQSASESENEDDVRGTLIEKMESVDPDFFNISYDDLKGLKKVGEGNFGRIWKGDYFGTRVAVKQLLDIDDEDMHKYIEREMMTLRTMRHPNIVQFMGLCKHSSGIYIVTEYISGGNLRKKLKQADIEMGWPLRVKIALDICTAMAYLHSRNIIHRDLKSQNLLVEKNWRIKVCDFGFSRSVDKTEVMTVCGTDEWMAPEVALGRQYDEKADVFSAAMVLVEIATRQKPPERSHGRAFAFDAAGFRKAVHSDTPSDFVQLTIDMAEFYPEKRPPFRDAMKRLKSIKRRVDKQALEIKKTKKASKMGDDLTYLSVEVAMEDASSGSPGSSTLPSGITSGSLAGAPTKKSESKTKKNV